MKNEDTVKTRNVHVQMKNINLYFSLRLLFEKKAIKIQNNYM